MTRAILFAVTGLLLTSAGTAQTRELRQGSCVCDIVLRKTATLGEEGPGAVGTFLTGARSSDGLFHVVSLEEPYVVKVFSPEGDYMHSIGRRGEGPLEFQLIRQVIASGDSVLLFDRTGRVEVVSSNGTRRHGYRVPRLIGAAVTNSGLVINSDVRTAHQVGIPLHLVRDGEIVRSFGSVDGAFRQDTRWPGWRRITRGGPNGVWTTALTQYKLEHWTLDGRLRQAYTRTAYSFDPTARIGDPDAPPPAVIADIEMRGHPTLFVLVTVPDRSWRDGLRRDRSHPDGPRWVIDDFHAYFDTVIELVDVDRGLVLATKRVDEYIPRFLDSSHVALSRITDQAAIEIWEVTTPTDAIGRTPR